MEVRRNRWARGQGAAASPVAQLELSAIAGGRFGWSDDIVAQGSGPGVQLRIDERSSLLATHVTVAGNAGLGVGRASGSPAFGRVTLFNSIVFANSPNLDLPATAERRRNLVGVDPHFVNAATGDYRLLPGSPAIDLGENEPPGGVGPTDIDGLPRRSGARVDAGAHEFQNGAAAAQSGLCRVDRFGVVPGVAATVPACTCFRDDVARSVRCGFFFPDLFFDVRIPLAVAPGAKLTTDWTLHPWTRGAVPYAMAAVLLDKQNTPLPVDPAGHASGKLVPGKDVAVRVGLATPDAPTVLRLGLRYLPAGATKPVDSIVEILVPQY
jgi:hypothetical protein